MSKLIQSYATSAGNAGEESPFVVELKGDYPELVQAMRGTKTIDGQCVLPPCTLMIFLEGDRMGFCLSPKNGNRVCFGTVSDPAKGLQSIESEIAAGHFEWKNKRSR